MTAEQFDAQFGPSLAVINRKVNMGQHLTQQEIAFVDRAENASKEIGSPRLGQENGFPWWGWALGIVGLVVGGMILFGETTERAPED